MKVYCVALSLVVGGHPAWNVELWVLASNKKESRQLAYRKALKIGENDTGSMYWGVKGESDYGVWDAQYPGITQSTGRDVIKCRVREIDMNQPNVFGAYSNGDGYSL